MAAAVVVVMLVVMVVVMVVVVMVVVMVVMLVVIVVVVMNHLSERTTCTFAWVITSAVGRVRRSCKQHECIRLEGSLY